MLKAHETLVIGHTGLSGVDCVSWQGDIPNIVDYDLCIVDQSTLTSAVLSALPYEHLGNIRTLLCRLIKSNGHLVVVYEKVLRDKNRTNIDWSPVEYSVHEETGNSIQVSESKFATYLGKMKSWQRFLISARCAHDLTRTLRAHDSDKIDIFCEDLMLNRESRALAWTWMFGVFHTKMGRGYTPSSYYGDKPDQIYGQVTFLPRLSDKDSGESVRTLLYSFLGVEQTAELPAWIGDLALPGLGAVEAEIDQHKLTISRIEQQIADAEAKRSSVLAYAKLVTSTGAELENAVADAFTDLGANVIPAKYSQEEFVVVWREREYLFEVKGVSKSIALTHLRQLMHYMLKFQEDTGRLCKAVLYGNAWREISPELRETPDTPIFPPNVIETATTHHLGLLSSVIFFEAYCSYKRGERTGESVLDTVLGADGVINIPMGTK